MDMEIERLGVRPLVVATAEAIRLLGGAAGGSLIDASLPTGLDQRSGVGGLTTTVTGMSRRWQNGYARNSRLGEQHSNVGSTNADKEQNDEPIDAVISTRAAEPNRCRRPRILR